eukprot:694750-Rhodomonas_salina.1
MQKVGLHLVLHHPRADLQHTRRAGMRSAIGVVAKCCGCEAVKRIRRSTEYLLHDADVGRAADLVGKA